MANKDMKDLAKKISELLDQYEVGYQTAIYYDNERLSHFTNKGWIVEKGLKGSDFTEYANDKTITMTFEGGFYEVINYGLFEELHEKFNKLLKSYGYYYELGNAWNLALYE